MKTNLFHRKIKQLWQKIPPSEKEFDKITYTDWESYAHYDDDVSRL